MKLIPSATALIAAAILTFGNASVLAQQSESTLGKIERTGEIVMGYRGDSSPLSFQDSEGDPSGYSVDICRHIAAGVNAHFPEKEIATRFVRIESGERINAVVDGRIDIECGSTTITLSRQERVDFSLPTFVTGGSVLSLARTGIQSFADLDGRKVGVIEGTTTVEQLRSHLANTSISADVRIVEDRTDGMDQLNRGSIDALASDQIVLIGQVVNARDPSKYSVLGEIFSYEPYGFVVRRNDADFRLVVNKAISRLYRTGEHGEIFYDWIGSLGINVPPVVAAMYQLNALPE